MFFNILNEGEFKILISEAIRPTRMYNMYLIKYKMKFNSRSIDYIHLDAWTMRYTVGPATAMNRAHLNTLV